ncbi:intercellular adhesion molecule 5 isoform X2 [Chanodichthys erythropterus]|uniref:intercellular adhesion molecule 5 isoform X2 n=1 Tax=Chanodichthys erythropterus TaxID=933992 RepID=UPI00351E9876
MLLLQQLIGLLLINLAYGETPDSVSISTVNHTGPMIEGNQYELQCDVLNVAPVQNLTVKWYKGETLVNQTTFTDTIKTPVDKTATLMIRPDRSDDGVQYRCEAELNLGEEGPQPPPKVTSDPLSITVHYKPIINETKLPSTVSVFRKHPVVLVCKAEGNPEPTISWNLGTNNTVYSETLTITDSTPEDLSCIANNSVGTDTRHVKVSVKETPDSVSISTVNHIGPMIEGNQYELQCDVLNVAPVQNLTVKWYKGETLVDQTTFTDTIKTPVNETVTLMIRPDRSDDGVQYRCEAELNLGEEGPQPPPKVTSKPLSITVHYKPIIIETKLPSTVSVFRGYTVVIVCKAEGNPEPTISWNLGTNNTVYNETLTITDSTPEDLSCIANNSVGNTTRHVKVSVKETPDSVSISTVNPTGPMIEGNQYELQCDVLNVAPVQNLTVKWYKGETLVDQTTFTDTIKTPVDKTATLMIRPDRSDDGVQYRCEAELNLGAEGPQPPPKVISDPLSITVHYKPIINETKLPSTVSVFRGYTVVIVCKAEGNPEPTISWNLGTNNTVYSETLTITDSTPEDLSCIANNSVGTDIRHVKVSVKDGDCPVELNPQRVVVRYGGSVAVNCSTNVPHDGMGWEASEGLVPMSSSVNLITWRVSNLTEWDTEPFCFINPKGGKQCASYLPVTIYKTPDSVSISTVNPIGPMIEGNQYELQCDVLNVAPVQNLTVKWYKGETLVNQTTFTDTIKTPVDKTATLMIRPDRSDDGVQYRCEAELNLGAEGPQPSPKDTSDSLSITVHYKPQINLCEGWSPKNGTPLVSYPNLNYIKGNPRPNISWRRKSSLLSASVPLNTNDSGKYELTASNELGHFTCSINILVEYPPKLNCSERYEVKEQTDWQPPCLADGLPKPDIVLYKNGKNLKLPFYLKWNDSGLYHLNATNKHGSVISYFTLNILYAPMIHASQDKFSVEEDSSITLECNSTGNPEPDVWWSFNNKNISTGRRYIVRATSTSAGVYTCSAKSNVGHKDKNFVVEIKGKPPNYIPYVVVALLVVLIILLCLYLWKRKKTSGSYDIQPEYEMFLLSNGGTS